MCKKISKVMFLILSLLSIFTFISCYKGDNKGLDETEVVVVTGYTELLSALNSKSETIKIILTEGNYPLIYVNDTDTKIHLCADGEVSIKGIKVQDGVKGLTIEKVSFSSIGVEIHAAEDVTIKKCTFTGNAFINSGSHVVKNLTIDGCVFNNYGNRTTLSAIKIFSYNGLTVKNCDFKYVRYNALQIGSNDAIGNVLIQNNTFKDIGSRVIYLVSIDKLTACIIQDNIFYDNVDALLQEGETSEYKKSDGIYIHTKSTNGKIFVNKNTWEIIPEFNNIYITELAEFKKNEQVELKQS